MTDWDTKKMFSQIWMRKLNAQHSSYAPGSNLRVNKALQVLPSGLRLLDIGCGDGLFLEQAQGRMKEVCGIDIAQEAVGATQQRGIQAHVVDLNTKQIPYPNGYFSAITMLSVIQYFYDIDFVVQECHRVLSDTGFLLLSVPNMRALWRVSRLLFKGQFPKVSMDQEGYDGGTVHYFASANIKSLLQSHGFQTLWTHGIFCQPRFVARFPDKGFIGHIKREFFSAETFVFAQKLDNK